MVAGIAQEFLLSLLETATGSKGWCGCECAPGLCQCNNGAGDVWKKRMNNSLRISAVLRAAFVCFRKLLNDTLGFFVRQQ